MNLSTLSASAGEIARHAGIKGNVRLRGREQMKPYKVHRVGDPSSKYAYHPEQLDEDIKRHQCKEKLFRQRVRNLILDDPSKMHDRFLMTVDELKNVKEEFGL